MRELSGKVAVVTGGASGIGRATGALFAERGMRVVLSDIEQQALDGAVEELRGRGLDVRGVRTDVASFESCERMRDETLRLFGPPHVVFLNAGVAPVTRGSLWELEMKDWQWAFAVNVWGVIHGIKALVSALVEQGEGGHVVITSSSVGVVAPTASGVIYNTTKAAELSIAESLYGQLKELGPEYSASVLVPPGTINTGLFTSARNRQPEYAPPEPGKQRPPLSYEKMLEMMNKSGNYRRPVQPEEVAEYVLEGVENDVFWLLPGPRHADMQENFDRIIRARADSMLSRGDPLVYLQKST